MAAHWLGVGVRPRLWVVAHTHKCPQCGSPVSGTRAVCPRCEGAMAQPRNWDDRKQSCSVREEKRHAANTRMRNSGVGLFIMGILLLSRGVEASTNTLTPIGSIGVLFIVFGTICFLWAWRLIQLEK